MNNDNTNPLHRHEIGQGIIEYALWIILALILIAALLGILTLGVAKLSGIAKNPCAITRSFECSDYQVEQCLASEKYTKEQCVQLVGGGK